MHYIPPHLTDLTYSPLHFQHYQIYASQTSKLFIIIRIAIARIVCA